MAIDVLNWVWEYSWSRHGSRLVLLAIADCGEVASISVSELVRKTLLAERAVQMATAELVALGELAVEYNAGSQNRYRILMHMNRLPMPEPTVRDPIPVETRLFIFERDGWRCRHCHTADDLTIDHIVPRSRGGSHAKGNLQTLCRPCNSRKGARV